MKKTILVFGLVIGTILSANMVLMVNQMYSNPNMKGNDVFGYATMIVLFSLIFVGVRNYRNKQPGGLISFGKSFKIGALTTLIASTIYVVVWLFYYYFFVPDFIEIYTSHVLNNCTSSGLAEKTAEMANFKERYKNPLFVILITYMEVLPVGLIVALVSALILRKQSTNINTI